MVMVYQFVFNVEQTLKGIVVEFEGVQRIDERSMVRYSRAMDAFYPMPMFINLDVSDLVASAAWYQAALGFRVIFGSPATMVHLRREEYQDLLLYAAQPDQAGVNGRGVVIQFQAGERRVAEIAEQARAAGAEVDGPVARPWNVRDVTIIDPDGYRLRFSEPVDANKRFDEVTKRVWQKPEN